jgi:hypothetical protein
LRAVSLLEGVPTLERDLMAQMAGANETANLAPIVWSEVGSLVYVPQWTRLVQLNAARLEGVTPDSLGQVAANLESFGKQLKDYLEDAPDTDTAEAVANAVVGAALTLLLIRYGGRLNVRPGSAISVELGGHDVKPFAVLMTLKDGQMTAHTWAARCVELGIAGADLGAVAAPAFSDAD